MALEDLDFQTIDRWIVDLKQHGGHDSGPLGNETVSKACQILSKTLDRAVKSGHISSNPCRHVRRPKAVKKQLKIITEIEIARLASVIDVRFHALVYLACYAGLRAGELFGLKWSNVDLPGRRVMVSNTVVETNGQLHADQPPKSDAGRRTVPLSREATRALVKHAEMFGNRPDDYVFPNEDGNAMRLSNFRNRYWKPALMRAGMDPSFRIHDERHTAISLWIMAGINPKDVSVHAGHTSVAFTLDRYGHLYPDNGDAFLRALDAATDKSLGISGARLGARNCTHPRHHLREQGKSVGERGPDAETEHKRRAQARRAGTRGRRAGAAGATGKRRGTAARRGAHSDCRQSPNRCVLQHCTQPSSVTKETQDRLSDKGPGGKSGTMQHPTLALADPATGQR